MNKIKLYGYYTEDISMLKDMFIASIKDDWEINIKKLESLDGDNDFGSKQFSMITNNKISYLRDKISENMNSIIIYSDMDIQFLRSCNDILLDLIKDNDILFQHEDPKVEFKTINTGFMVIKCNEKTFKLFDECSKFNADKYKFFDQSIIQDYIYLINTNCVKWDVLPLEFYNKIHGDILPENIILHHANLTFKEIDKDGKLITSLEKKIEQLNLVKNEVLNRK